ncbi:MAG: IS1 family transposase [Hyphomicrobiaceae bacterium]
MHKLPLETRVQILQMLCEGSSMRSISRVTGVSINTVSKLLVDAGEACAAFHDATVRSVPSKAVQCDEIWSFSYVKQRPVKFAKAAPEAAGDVWTWIAIDADSKLIVSWHVGDRSADTGAAFMFDLKGRLANRVQLTTDGHKAYLKTVLEAGFEADYAMLNKIFATDYAGPGRDSPPKCIGKKFKNHCHALALYFVFYNFCRVHKTLGATPAMASGLVDKVLKMSDLVALIDAREVPAVRGSHKKKAAEISN